MTVSASATASPSAGLVGRTLRSRTLLQTLTYAGSSALSGLLISIAAALLARHFSNAAFGSYSFGVSFLKYTALFFEFGLFYPIARHAAKRDGSGNQRV